MKIAYFLNIFLLLVIIRDICYKIVILQNYLFKKIKESTVQKRTLQTNHKIILTNVSIYLEKNE